MVAIFIVGFIAVKIFYDVTVNSTEQVSTTTSASNLSAYQAPPKPPHIAVETLFNEYHTNEVKADQDYKGKRITMTIRVDQVSKDMFDGGYVEYHLGRYGLANLWFYFDDQNYLASLKCGSNLNIEGTCTGMVMGTIIFKHSVPSSDY